MRLLSWPKARLSVQVVGLILCAALDNRAEPAPFPHGTVDLIAAEGAIERGQPFTVGLYFKLQPGWHIYWTNPGDSGQPPKLQWTVPAGLHPASIAWPVPKRLPVGPLMDYGYEGDVLLPIPVQTDANLSGSAADLKAHLRVLVCRETCIPGKADLALTLPVAPTRRASRYKALFDDVAKRMPLTLPAGWQVEAMDEGSDLQLAIRGAPSLEGAQFFPATPEVIENAAPQQVMKSPDGFTLKLKKAAGAAGTAKLAGLLVTPDAANPAYEIAVPVAANASARGSKAAQTEKADSSSIAGIIAFAFLGGLILNLMPCVFPVLSIKALSVLGSSASRVSAKASSLVYTLGILVSFWILVAVLLTLRSAGSHLGWGFQLQSPGFVAVLICFLFLFALNLVGVFEVGQSFMGAGSGLANRSGYSGSFFTGVLATVVATPCTAPFMGTAIAFALAQPAFICLLVFTSMALGLSLPFLILAFVPGATRFLPRPGRWMEMFKHLMAFPVFATVIWLLWVLGLQAGIDGLVRILAVLLAIALAVWIFGHWTQSKIVSSFAAVFVLAAFVYGARAAAASAKTNSAISQNARQGRIAWEPFSPDKLASYRSAGKPVLIDFTAAWCLTCQVNERVAFGARDVQERLEKGDIALLRADWTSYDPAITETLSNFGRSGVPLYVMYGRGSQTPVFLPDGLFGPSTVIGALKSLKL